MISATHCDNINNKIDKKERGCRIITANNDLNALNNLLRILKDRILSNKDVHLVEILTRCS